MTRENLSSAVKECRFTESLPVYFDLYTPPKRTRARLPLLIALHGYAGNKESMMRLARNIDEENLLIASLQGPYQFMILPSDGASGAADVKTGFNWRTQYKADDSIELHHRILLQTIDLLSREARADASRVFLMSFSQAVALNYRFVFTNPNMARGVIGVCGGVPGDLETGGYKPSNTDVLHIAADQDQFYPLDFSRSFKPRLAPFVPNVDLRIYKGSHVFPRRSLPQIAQWIKARI